MRVHSTGVTAGDGGLRNNSQDQSKITVLRENELVYGGAGRQVASRPTRAAARQHGVPVQAGPA